MTRARLVAAAIIGVLLAMVLELAAHGQAVDTPAQVQGTGFDVVAWALDKYGLTGLVGWAVWTISRLAGRITGLPIVLQLHPDDRSLLRKLVRQAVDGDVPSSESDPTPDGRGRR